MAYSMPSGISGSSSSSFTSSALGFPPGDRARLNVRDASTWTPSSSATSALTSESSLPPTSLRPLSLGPPGYQATINLFERTPGEKTIYLGPWDIIDTDSRRVVWQCSYQGETLQQFLPSDDPTHIHPFTFHARHRPYSDPKEMELFLSFREPHRIRYTKDGVVIFDELMDVKYEFTSFESSLRFQGDLRRRDLADYFDVDVIWSDTYGRTDSLTGTVRGLATIQRMKLWRDRYSTYHYLTFYSNRPSSRQERRFREYGVSNFETEVRHRDDRHRECRLTVQGRRGSAPENSRTRSFSISSPSSWANSRHRQRSTCGPSSHSDASASNHISLDIRWLGIRFSREADYRRFLEQWDVSHSADSEFRGIPFPSNHFELPSPQIRPEDTFYELPSPAISSRLPSVHEPGEEEDYPT